MAFGRLEIVLALIPSAASLLRMKDTNNTGVDDLIADLLDFAGDAVMSAQAGQPLPKLPESLRSALGLVTLEEAQALGELAIGKGESEIVSSAADAKAIVEASKE